MESSFAPTLDRVYSAVMDLAGQKRLVLSWLQGPAALERAGLITNRWPSAPFTPGDLVQDAWVRLSATFDRRSDPYPEISDPESVERFCTRVFDNLARDRMRTVRRRAEVVIDDSSVPQVDGDLLVVEQRAVLHRLIEFVGRRGTNDVECVGCPSEVVVAAALEVVHLVLIGHEGSEFGRTWMDRLLHQALEHVIAGEEPSHDARMQRKSRCGRCVVALLSGGMEAIMGDSDE